MEKKNITSILANKKLLLAGVSVIIVLIPLVMLLETNKSEKQQETNATITGIPTKYVEKTEQKELVKWQPYTSDEFTMQYPPEWKASEYKTPTGDLTIIIRPTILPVALTYPQFIVQVQHNAPSAMKNKQGFLVGFKLAESKTTVNGNEAILYSGTIPFRTEGGKTVQKPIQDTTILYQNENTLYTFKYEYEGQVKDQKLETFFGDIINTFKTSK